MRPNDLPLSLARAKDIARLASPVGIWSVPLGALECELATGTFRLANEEQQFAYLAAIRRRHEYVGSQAWDARSRSSGRYQDMVRASMLHLARDRVAVDGVEHLAAASVNSIAIDFPRTCVEQVVDIACALSVAELTLLRIYEEIATSKPALDHQELGYRIGAAVTATRPSGDAAESSLQQLQKMRLVAAGTDLPLDLDRPYLPACRVTELGRLVLRLLQEVGPRVT